MKVSFGKAFLSKKRFAISDFDGGYVTAEEPLKILE